MARAAQVARFYAEHAPRLERAVARRVHAPRPAIDDACQTAWAVLLRRPDITLDHSGLAWLATVAAREGWRLACATREVPAGAFLLDDRELGVLPEPPADAADPADHVLARAQRVEDLARLKPREREALYLKGLGYRYQEIAALTDSTYTAVNRRISEGRARLLVRERDDAARGTRSGANIRPTWARRAMSLQPITYRGRTVAAASHERFVLSDDLEARAAGDAERTFVVLMCLYARDVAHGVLPGPYRDDDARRYARLPRSHRTAGASRARRGARRGRARTSRRRTRGRAGRARCRDASSRSTQAPR